MLIAWSDTFSVQNSEIDNQHKKLIDIINEFHQKITAGPEYERKILPEIIDELFQYTVYHFNFEEELMKNSSYENYEGHRKIHEEMKLNLEDMKQRLIQNQMVLSIEMLVFLQDWLVEHILGCDMLYRGKI